MLLLWSPKSQIKFLIFPAFIKELLVNKMFCCLKQAMVSASVILVFGLGFTKINLLTVLEQFLLLRKW